MTDAERLDWLEKHLFSSHWCGEINTPKDWSVVGSFRHVTTLMRGKNLREAIDKAMETI